MKKILLIITVLIFASCSKNKPIEPTCHFYKLLSDKYTADSVYVKTDTLNNASPYNYACRAELDSMKAHKITWYHNCIGYPIQCERYVFDNEIELPKLFK